MRKSRFSEEYKQLIIKPDYLFKCKKCGVIKPNSEFNKKPDDKRIRQYSSNCKICQSLYAKVRNKSTRTKEKNRIDKLRQNFGLSIEKYNNMLEAQNNKCAICNIDQRDLKRNFDVDHCHKTGKIRGLLCHNCNVAIGLFRENTEVIQNSIEYLNLHKK